MGRGSRNPHRRRAHRAGLSRDACHGQGNPGRAEKRPRRYRADRLPLSPRRIPRGGLHLGFLALCHEQCRRRRCDGRIHADLHGLPGGAAPQRPGLFRRAGECALFAAGHETHRVAGRFRRAARAQWRRCLGALDRRAGRDQGLDPLAGRLPGAEPGDAGCPHPLHRLADRPEPCRCGDRCHRHPRRCVFRRRVEFLEEVLGRAER